MKITVIVTLPLKYCATNINNSFKLSMLANDHGIKGDNPWLAVHKMIHVGWSFASTSS